MVPHPDSDHSGTSRDLNQFIIAKQPSAHLTSLKPFDMSYYPAAPVALERQYYSDEEDDFYEQGVESNGPRI